MSVTAVQPSLSRVVVDFFRTNFGDPNRKREEDHLEVEVLSQHASDARLAVTRDLEERFGSDPFFSIVSNKVVPVS